MPVLKLRFAEKLDVVGVKGVAGSKVSKAARRPDLVALENLRIALDRLHQRAGLALFGRGALAEAAAAQSGPELIDALGRRREIVEGEKIGVHRQIDLDPLEPRNHPVSGLTCLRKRATVARDVTVRYPPLVMMSCLPSAISMGFSARRGLRSFLLPQV